MSLPPHGCPAFLEKYMIEKDGDWDIEDESETK
jgi:hypothetical protein